MIAVTTFSPEGYKVYGKKFLESFVEHWPCNLVVYHEGEEPDFQHDKVRYDYLFAIPGAKVFYQYLQSLPGADGWINGRYDYNRDALKFTRKVFAQLSVLRLGEGKVIWLDADIETYKPVSYEFLESTFGGKTLTMLQREGFHTEAAYVGFDTNGEGFPDFLDAYTKCLQKGIFLTLDRWHDCAILDWAVEQSKVPVNNLSPFYDGRDLHVFPKSVLGNYLIHNKGSRKYGKKPKDLPKP